MRRKILFSLITIWLASVVVIVSKLAVTNNNLVKVIFCDVGQGDATLIISGQNQILIDSGRNNRVVECLENHLPGWDREIELVIATHADSDHIGGFEMVLKRYFIKEMLISEYASTTDVFKRFRESVLREIEDGMRLKLATTNGSQIIGQKLQLYSFVSRVEGFENNPFLEVNPETLLWDKIAGQNQAIKNQGLSLNALSIVTFLQVGEVKFLLMGDLDVKREQALVERGLIADVDVLKVGHHGSKTSTSDQLLDSASPEIAIISVGYNNNYGLPSPQVVSKIEQFGSLLKRTDQDGEVVVVTNGQDYWFEE